MTHEQFGPEWETAMMKFNKKQLIETIKRVQSEKKQKLVKCRLWEVELEKNWVKFEVSQAVMDKGFHAGSARIDFSGVQD